MSCNYQIVKAYMKQLMDHKDNLFSGFDLAALIRFSCIVFISEFVGNQRLTLENVIYFMNTY